MAAGTGEISKLRQFNEKIGYGGATQDRGFTR
jgi:hypothetical protein